MEWDARGKPSQMMTIHKVKLQGGGRREEMRPGGDDVTARTRALCRDVVDAYRQALRDVGDVEDRQGVMDLMRVQLESQEYAVRKETRWGRNGFRGVRHSFLVVTASPGGTLGSAPVIIDAAFKDLFDIARHSPRYAAVFDEIPELFVHTPSALRKHVVRLCWEMELSFYQTGLSVPPIRQPHNMLWRWGV